MHAFNAVMAFKNMQCMFAMHHSMHAFNAVMAFKNMLHVRNASFDARIQCHHGIQKHAMHVRNASSMHEFNAILAFKNMQCMFSTSGFLLSAFDVSSNNTLIFPLLCHVFDHLSVHFVLKSPAFSIKNTVRCSIRTNVDPLLGPLVTL